MSFSPILTNTLNQAAAKAFATSGHTSINVVPVSMIRVLDTTIWLFDFFMSKTAENIQSNPNVALTAWTGMVGVQIKAEATYFVSGTDFDEAVAYVKSQNPDRVVKGLIVLRPTAIFDISPGGAFAETDLALP